jgi:hypothetical protein
MDQDSRCGIEKVCVVDPDDDGPPRANDGLDEVLW